jgi:alpha-1,3-rhamnosyl/mannosyltransferase
MRIAFDARHAARGLGIANFVTHLAQALIELGGHELIWLGDPAVAPAGVDRCARADRLPYPALDGPLGRALVRRLRADVVHFTGNTGWGRPGPVPAVLTLHDLVFVSTGLRRHSVRQIVGHRYERWLIPRSLPAATILAVPSQTVAEDVSKRFPAVAPAQVIPEGVTPPPDLSRVKRNPPYIVAFAGRDPRKRTAEVVDGWRALGPLPVRLCLLTGGGLEPGLRDRLGPAIQTGSVELFDYLPRTDLWKLLAGALALAYPTSAEGFGLPVLEGMAAGTPVLTGLAPVSHEIGGDAIVALDERDVAGSIAAAVRRLHADPAYAQAVAGRGRARASEFSWRRTAQRYAELYVRASERFSP